VKRFQRTLVLASIAACGLLLVVFPVSYWLEVGGLDAKGRLVSKQSIRIVSDFRAGFEGGRLWVFNYAAPYQGSTIAIVDSSVDPAPVGRSWHWGNYGVGHEILFAGREKISEWGCDLPGVYFRHIWRQRYSPPMTSLGMSLWYPISISAALPLWWIFRHSRFRPGQPLNLRPCTAPQPEVGRP
jgi:hypothetical protein